MNRQGTLALLMAPLLLGLAGCLPQNAQTQGLNNTQTAAGPCAPNATADLISTGRSLLAITNSVLATQQSLNGTSGTSATYAQRVQAAEHAQKVNQGNEVLDNVEALTGGATAPCTPTSAAR